MSSHPSGLRFSPSIQSPQQQQQQQQKAPGHPRIDLDMEGSSGQSGGGGASGRLSEARLFGVGSNSNRNSLKETNSNRSSMDTTSYNTLIIHNDVFNSPADFGGSTKPLGGKNPPLTTQHLGTRISIGEVPAILSNMSVYSTVDIMEIPDDYNQGSVLKQLVKEMSVREVQVPESDCSRPPPKYGHATAAPVNNGKGHRPANDDVEEEEDADSDEDAAGLSKLKSKSQPDLSRIIDIDLETIEALMKENELLKQQLNTCYKKVARTKKVGAESVASFRLELTFAICSWRKR